MEKNVKALCYGQISAWVPLATEFTAQLFTTYRAKRLDGHFARTKRVAQVSPRTMNLEHAYFLAVFNELKGWGMGRAKSVRKCSPVQNRRK